MNKNNNGCSHECENSKGSGVFHLTKKVDTGVSFLLALRDFNAENTCSLNSIAEKYDMSFYFLQNIARDFKKAGLVGSGRGKAGGYYLMKKPKDILLKNVVEALEGPVALVKCLAVKCKNKNGCCGRGLTCMARDGFKKLNDELNSLLLSKSLKYF